MNTKTKKYILVQNDEEIDILAFNLIGASTKRDDDNKIGFFGSGLKYSLAYALRNNIEIKIAPAIIKAFDAFSIYFCSFCILFLHSSHTIKSLSHTC